MGFHASKNTVKKTRTVRTLCTVQWIKVASEKLGTQKDKDRSIKFVCLLSPHNNQRTQNSTLQVHYTGQCTVHSTLQIKKISTQSTD